MVLVLGPGASKPYGFPTGPELIKRIMDMLEGSGPTVKLLERTGFKWREIRLFCNALYHSGLTQIDAFLENNPKYIGVGKAAIASALLPCENSEVIFKEKRIKGEPHWYEYLFNRIGSSFNELPNNKLSIVTFNYDRSIEFYLFVTFRQTNERKKHEECVKQFKRIPIIHVYGSLGPLPLNDCEDGIKYNSYWDSSDLKKWYQSIDILRKGRTPKNFKEAHNVLMNANRIYFLGFGFHPINVERLGLRSLKQNKEIRGTCMGLPLQEKMEMRKLFKEIKAEYKSGEFLIDTDNYHFLHDYAILD